MCNKFTIEKRNKKNDLNAKQFRSHFRVNTSSISLWMPSVLTRKNLTLLPF